MITLKKMNKMNKNTFNSSFSSSSVIMVQKQNEYKMRNLFFEHSLGILKNNFTIIDIVHLEMRINIFTKLFQSYIVCHYDIYFIFMKIGF